MDMITWTYEATGKQVIKKVQKGLGDRVWGKKEQTWCTHYGGLKGYTFKEIPLGWRDNTPHVICKEYNWLTLHKLTMVGSGPVCEPLLWNNNPVSITCLWSIFKTGIAHKEERSYIHP
jgi:hypothetical protein